MDHAKRVKKLGRTASHRKSMLANMASSLIIHERIRTTVAKAKACKSYVDKVISEGRSKDEVARRRLLQLLRDKVAVEKVMKVLADRFEDRVGGYTTIVKIGRRKGDNAQMAKLMLIGSEPFKKERKVRAKSKRKMRVKEKKGEIKRKSFLDRVREIRGRVSERAQDQDRGQVDKQEKKVETRSRAGI